MLWILLTVGLIPKEFQRQSQSEDIQSSGLQELDIVDAFIIRCRATDLMDVS